MLMMKNIVKVILSKDYVVILKGSYVLKMELKQRGIKESIICRTLEQVNIDEFGDAVKLLEKKNACI